ncbi:MAG: tRNA pseudouridine(55) synthase TruB [Rhodopirellula sp.]|nr:tRNA pseudouridine(55) synthase TruB [Rhodopirellula sp.]
MKTLSGVLTINKPEGMTSRQTVTRVSNVLRQAGYGRQIRVGHCGTLDPLATGLVVICVGRSTRLVQLIQEHSKTYTGTFQLGCVTTTDDCTGEILCETSVDSSAITRLSILDLLPEFVGDIEQVPPKFSAVHVNGKRAYKLARQGHEVELAPRPVQIHSIHLTRFSLPEFELRIECGSGTYIRSLGRDMGERLGCGATMKTLNRSAIGPFMLDNAVAPEELTPENIESFVQSPIKAVAHLPNVEITEQQKALVYDGRPVDVGTIEQLNSFSKTDHSQADEDAVTKLVLLDAKQQLVAVSSYRFEDGTAKPDMVFHDPPRD